MSERLFGRTPWSTVPLPEPIHVEPGKSYQVTYDLDTPAIREIPDGDQVPADAIRFSVPGTVTVVTLFHPDTLTPGPAVFYLPEEPQ